MKILFSKAGELDGTFTVSPSGEASGHIQVYGLPLTAGSVTTEVSNAGTLVIDRLMGVPHLDPGYEGTLLPLKDLTLRGPMSPQKFKVQGRAVLKLDGSPDKIVNFVGTFHTTGYFQNAWSAILDPSWDPTRWF